MSERREDNFQEIEEICNEFLRQLKSGVSPSISELASQNPELAPDLQDRLELIEAVFLSAKSSESQEANRSSDAESDEDFQLARTSIKNSNPESGIPGLPFHNRARRVNCPHCGIVLQLVSREEAELTCHSCGSQVTFDAEATASEFSREIPAQIGRFQIMRLLGEGAFGAVFLASDPQLKRQVALKVPRSGYFSSSGEEQRFYREAQSAAKLRHSNIVPVHEVSQDSKAPYIVSEFIDGVTMSDLASTGLLTFKEIAELMIKVCDAVGHAHGNGVVHRDLKPSNILVDGHRNPWVADFGLARRDDAEITMTVDGMVLGTPAYMAPEQAAGIHEKVDARSDIYSLGVILYKLLARELPFSGTRRMLLHQVINDDPRSPRKFNDNIPKDLETITLKALNKNQEHRFQSADEFKAELQRWLSGEPIFSRPTPVSVRFWKWCQRYPLVAVLCASILFLLVSGIVFATYKANLEAGIRKVAESSASEARREKGKRESTLRRIYHVQANKALDENRLLDSGYWYAKALEIEDSAIDRMRLAALYERSPRLQSVFQLESRVESLAMTKDGSRLAVGTSKGKVKVFDLEKREAIFEASSQDGFPVSQVEFLLAGKSLLFRSSADESQLWSIGNAKMIRQIDISSKIKKDAAISPAGEKLVIASPQSGIEIYDSSNGKLLSRKQIEGRIDILKFFSEETVLVGVWLKDLTAQEFRLIDIGKKAPVWTLKLEQGTEAFFSRDQRRIATLQGRKRLKIWDALSGKQVGETFDSETAIRRVLFASNGTVSCISNDRQVQTLSFAEKNQLVSTDYLEFRPVTLHQAGNSEIVVVDNQNGELQFLVQGTWSEANSRISGDQQTILASSDDGSLVASGGLNQVKVWDLAGALPSFFEFKHERFVRDGIFGPGGKRCYTISEDGKAKIWDTSNGQRVGEVMAHAAMISGCQLTPDGQRFVTVGFDKKAKLWDAITGEQFGASFPHDSPLVELSISPDGGRLLTGCLDGSCYCWDIAAKVDGDPEPVYSVKLPGAVRRIDYARSGEFFATVSFEGFVRLWDANTGNPIGSIETNAPAIDCRLCPDASVVLVVSRDQTASLWATKDQTLVASFDLASDPKHIAFDQNNRFRISDFSGTTSVWHDKGKGFEQLASFKHPALAIHRHAEEALSEEILWAAGGSNVGSSGSGAVAIWSTEDGKLVVPPLTHQSEVWRARLGPNGKMLLASTRDGTAKLWDLGSIKSPPDRLAKLFLAMHNLKAPDAADANSSLGPENNLAPDEQFPYMEVVPRQKEQWRKRFVIAEDLEETPGVEATAGE